MPQQPIEIRLLHELLGGEIAKKVIATSLSIPEAGREAWLAGVVRLLTTGDNKIIRDMRYKAPPVSVETFINDPYYLNKRAEIYPVILSELIELNSGRYDEAVLTGGIGSGKSTMALYTQAYQLYLLSMLRSPHALFGIDKTSEIKIVFQAVTERVAKDGDFMRFMSLIDHSPYFNSYFMYDTGNKSLLKFPNRIEVEPLSGAETASIGQNVIGGIIEEINFMKITQNSRHSTDGKDYDQATELYNSIARRRKSRFMSQGLMPGILCLVSSKKVPGQFTDRKEAEAKTNPRIFLYNKRVWDVKPASFSGVTFSVFVGDGGRSSRIIHPGESIALADVHLIDNIPIEFEQDFQDDITKSLRDIAGRSTLAIHPYLSNRDAVLACFGKRENLFIEDSVDFVAHHPAVHAGVLPVKDGFSRFAHIDLGLTGDSAGLVIGHVNKFVTVPRGDVASEQLPNIVIDAVLEIRPPRGGEIEFSNIRRVLYRLRELGLPIKWVTADTYQSSDSLQILKQSGFITGVCSMDTSMVPYDMTKQALYDGRVELPQVEKLSHELLTLERDFKRNKVDHSAHGCHTGETQVECADGVLRTFEELAKDYKIGIEHTGLTWDHANGCYSLAKLQHPRVTKYATELVEIVLDNGVVIRVTPEHPYMLEDGSYVEAQHLTTDMALKF